MRPTPTLPRMVPVSEFFRARWHRPDTPAPFDCSGEITLTGEQILGFVCRGFWDGKQHFRERLPFVPFPQKGASQEPTVFFFHRNPMHGRPGTKLMHNCVLLVSDDDLWHLPSNAIA